jgi:phosphate transport system substrate-binding protein
MKIIINLAIIAALLGSVSCGKDEPDPKDFIINGLTKENYPKVDGSTSAQPLQTLIACKLLGISYEWSYNPMLMHYTLYPPHQDEEAFFFIINNVRNTGTHSSIINLIEGNADFIITARGASEPEKKVAKEKNVKLLEIPVAIDAFIMIVNGDNPVNSLTTKQIQDIYTGNITNWVEVGGHPAEINPYKRNSTSGSQVLMESLIMKDLKMIDLPAMEVSPTMWGPFDLLSHDKNGICYTVYYYHEFMARAEAVKSLSIDGVHPGYLTLKTREYPYTTDVYAMIREDLDESAMAYKLFQILLTNAGRSVIKESGYVPL